MDLLDKVLLEWSARTDKGYPDLNNKQDLALFESLFGFNLHEGLKEKDAKKKIISTDPGKYEDMSNDFRIGNKSKVSADDFIASIKKAFPETEVEVTPPRTGKNQSGKFNLFTFKDDNDREISIYLAGGASANKGTSFELDVAQDLQNFMEGLEEYKYPKVVEEIIEEFKLTPDNFKIIPEGKENKKRPLVFSSDGPTVGFSGKSIAATLTDLTIKKDAEIFYISLKFGGTLTFFNAGVMKIFTAKEIQEGEVRNPDGVALLDMLGIDNELFCRVFNEYGETNFSEYKETVTDFDQEKLTRLVSSGIGSGYYMLKGKGASYDFFLVDKNYNNEASKPTSGMTIYYGGIGGTGKRVDVVFESSKYHFKVNIRNKQKGLYPSHIMCDYKAKK